MMFVKLKQNDKPLIDTAKNNKIKQLTTVATKKGSAAYTINLSKSDNLQSNESYK